MAGFNLADLFERLADAAAAGEAVAASGVRLTYGALDERSTRLANALAARGVAAGDHIGVYSANRVEFLEALLAAFKLRAVPINVNYRYVEAELRYIFDDSEIVALVYESQFAPHVQRLRPEFPRITTYLEIGGGDSVEATGDVGYEHALAQASAGRTFAPRSGDDRYIIYTGGTTGMPKGTVWRHEDVYFAAMGGGAWGGRLLGRPEDITDFAPAVLSGQRLTFGVVAPLMHGAAQWLALGGLLCGGRIALYTHASFEPAAVLRMVEAERVSSLAVVGDAMARPLADEMRTGRYDLSSLVVVGSGGAVLSDAVKQELRAQIPDLTIVDTVGSSEIGASGSGAGDGPRFTVGPDVAVLDESTLRPVEPGSAAIGKLARRGHIPVGYWKDEAKTAATFPVVDGVRWAVPGDYATVEADGTVVLLGRGSQCINTGGEKVFPEEVEAALKAHPSVYDAAVVGVPDERWVERVVAVVAPRGDVVPTLAEVDAHCRTLLAGYKVPRDLVVVDEVRRTPVGKLDLPWAKETALSRLTGGTGS